MIINSNLSYIMPLGSRKGRTAISQKPVLLTLLSHPIALRARTPAGRSRWRPFSSDQLATFRLYRWSSCLFQLSEVWRNSASTRRHLSQVTDLSCMSAMYALVMSQLSNSVLLAEQDDMFEYLQLQSQTVVLFRLE